MSNNDFDYFDAAGLGISLPSGFCLHLPVTVIILYRLMRKLGKNLSYTGKQAQTLGNVLV